MVERRRAAKKAAPRKRAASSAMHVVGPDDPAPAPVDTSRLTVSQALELGDELLILEATQRVLAKKIDDPTTSARDLSANIRRLHDNHKLIMVLKAERGDQEDGLGAAIETPDEAFDGTVGV